MKTRNYALDLLKILATSFIVLHHYEQGTQYAAFKFVSFYGGKFPFGNFVELFFIIPGYFTYIYVQKIQHGLEFKKFFKKKYFRLVPMLAISVFFETVIYWIRNCMGAENDLNFSRVVLNMLGVQTGWVTNTQPINGPTWYISVLLFCYVIFYTTTWISNKLDVSPYKFYAVIILAGMLIRTYGMQMAFLNMTMARGYIAFFVGVILARMINAEKEKGKQRLLIGAYIALIGFAFIYIFKFSFITNDMLYILDFIVWPAIVVISCMGKISGSLKSPVIGTISAISYNTYIMHEPLTAFRNLIMLIFKVDSSILASMSCELIFLGCAWLVGAFFYFGVERKLSMRCQV